MNDPNDLRVTPQDAAAAAPNGVSTLGAGIVDSSNRLVDSVRQGEWDDLSTYGHGALLALDTLGVALDPLGAVVKSTVGWLFRHVAFLREPVEFLTGDPNVVRALSDTWKNIGEALAGASKDYTGLLQGVRNWSGNAADAYRSLAAGYARGLHGFSGYASTLSTQLRFAAVLVATARGIVFETIASWVAGVVKRALAAAAAAWFTGGSSIALFLTSTVADAAILLGRVTKMIRKLLGTLRKFTDRFGSLRARADDLNGALRNAHRRLGRFGDRKRLDAGRPEQVERIRSARREGTIPGHLETFRNAVDKTGRGLPKEFVKQGNREIDREPHSEQPP